MYFFGDSKIKNYNENCEHFARNKLCRMIETCSLSAITLITYRIMVSHWKEVIFHEFHIPQGVRQGEQKRNSKQNIREMKQQQKNQYENQLWLNSIRALLSSQIIALEISAESLTPSQIYAMMFDISVQKPDKCDVSVCV